MEVGDKVIRSLEYQEDPWWVSSCRNLRINTYDILTVKRLIGTCVLFEETKDYSSDGSRYTLVRREPKYEIY